MRIATYHRVSTLDQRPELARDALRATAARLWGAPCMEVEETGSGANNDRRGLQRVLGAARKGEIDTLLVWKLDRLGRSTLDLLANVRALEASGVRLIITSQGLDIRPGGDAMSNLLLTMLAAIAEFERDMIRDRTRLGLAAARRRGKRLGRPPVKLPDARAVTALLAEGVGYADMATRLGCSLWAVRRAIEEYEI